MRSRWLDTGQVQFLHFYAPGLSPGPKEPKKQKKRVRFHFNKNQK